MTENKDSLEKLVRLVNNLYADDLEGTDLHMTRRDIGNGPQFALELYPEGEHTMLWESQWYTEGEFRAYLRGMDNAKIIERKAARE